MFFFFVGFPGGVWGGGPTWHHVYLVPDFGAKCATPSVGYLGVGPTWHSVSLVPDFGAKCTTSSCGLFEEGGAYLAMHVCAAGLWCHTCNLLLCGLICGLFGGANLAIHVCAARLQCHALMHQVPTICVSERLGAVGF